MRVAKPYDSEINGRVGKIEIIREGMARVVFASSPGCQVDVRIDELTKID